MTWVVFKSNSDGDNGVGFTYSPNSFVDPLGINMASLSAYV